MANIHLRPSWREPKLQTTPEDLVLNRRQWLKLAGGTGASLLASLAGCRTSYAQSAAGVVEAEDEPVAEGLRDLYPAKRNDKYKLDRPLTPRPVATSYNNFYEFDASSKTAPARMVRGWKVRPWEVEITGLVKKPIRIDADALARKMGLEERLYRFRCVEAWSMSVPWVGFPMSRLIQWAEPLGSAKHVRLVSFLDPEAAPGQKNNSYPWPYYEGLRLDEAANELALFVTGMYGKPLPKQNGAPLRAIVPWKYGYKSPKSIVRIEFVEQQPHTFWNDLTPREYGFLSNVNPQVPHPRWSQATERVIGTEKRVPTLLYNGYADRVAGLYKA